jgi:hypothetical protein
MDADTRLLLAIARALPPARRWRLRVAALLYGAGLRRLAVRVMGNARGLGEAEAPLVRGRGPASGPATDC